MFQGSSFEQELTMEAWEMRMVTSGKLQDIPDVGNLTFFETLPAQVNTLDQDHNDGDDDTFPGLK